MVSAAASLDRGIFTISKRRFSTTESCANGSIYSPTIFATGCRSATTRSSGPKISATSLSKPGEGFYFDDDKKSLKIRVERAYAKNAWAEMPPSRTRHLIHQHPHQERSTAAKSKSTAISSFTARAWKTTRILFVGERQDVLRRVDGGFKIAKRTIILDQAVLMAKNISVFL